jgi:hypothetical protein
MLIMTAPMATMGGAASRPGDVVVGTRAGGLERGVRVWSTAEISRLSPAEIAKSVL